MPNVAKLLAVYLASASWDNTVRLWDTTTRQPLGVLRGHTTHVRSVVFSPDGKLLASAGDEGTVRLWDPTTRKLLGNPLAGHTRPVYSLAFSPDGKMLASGSADATVRFWDVAHQQPLGKPLEAANGNAIEPLAANGNAIAFSPNGKVLASAGADATVRLWDVASRQPLGEPLLGHARYLNSIAFSPNGKMLASAGDDRVVLLWDMAGEHSLGESFQGHTNHVYSVAFSPNGKVLASASADNTVRLWDVASRQPLGEPLRGHVGAVRRVVFSADNKLLATASEDTTVRLWDVATRQCLGEPLQGHTRTVRDIAFSPNGSTILASVGADGTIRLWDVVARRPLGEPLKADAAFIAFHPNGKMLASASRNEYGAVMLWNVARSRRVGELQPAPVATGIPGNWTRETCLFPSRISFSPDGKVLASACNPGRYVRLWDVTTGGLRADSLREPPPGQSSIKSLRHGMSYRYGELEGLGLVSDAVFSPNGKLLASTSWEFTVRLWDLESGQAFGDLQGHTGNLTNIAFSPDGKLLATASEDTTVRLWDVDSHSWVARACARANRNLSSEEWHHYIGKDVPYRRTCPNLISAE